MKKANPTPEQLENVSIYVVDDDGMVRAIICEYLRHFGFKNIHEEKDGQVALNRIRDRFATIDLVISDWEMPKVNGITLLKAVREEPHRERTKFIMVTSQISQERMKIQRARHYEVDGYIVKPFRGEILQQKVYAALGWGEDQDEEKKTG